MHAATLKKLQEIGAFALAGGCTKKRMREVAEMIRDARDYRWVGIYKIMKEEFVVTARRWNRANQSWSATFAAIRAICRLFTRRDPRSSFRW